METATVPATDKRPQSGQIVEMSWDPITRIVGSLGLFTKIDFSNRKVVECHSTSSIFRGYSIFMKGKDPRDAAVIGNDDATAFVFLHRFDSLAERGISRDGHVIVRGQDAHLLFAGVA